MTRCDELQVVRGLAKSPQNLVAADVRRRTARACAAPQGCRADGRKGVRQGKFGQRNGGKGMGTGDLFVFIPLPPFLCQIGFGDWGSDSSWLRCVRRTGAPSIARHGAQPGRSGRAMLGAPPASVRSRRRTAGVPPASSRGVSPRVGTGGETPPKLAGVPPAVPPTSSPRLPEHHTGAMAPCRAFRRSASSRRRLHDFLKTP